MKKSNKPLLAVLIATFIVAALNSCSKQYIESEKSLFEDTDVVAVE